MPHDLLANCLSLRPFLFHIWKCKYCLWTNLISIKSVEFLQISPNSASESPLAMAIKEKYSISDSFHLKTLNNRIIWFSLVRSIYFFSHSIAKIVKLYDFRLRHGFFLDFISYLFFNLHQGLFSTHFCLLQIERHFLDAVIVFIV